MAAKDYSFLKVLIDNPLQYMKSDGWKSHGSVHFEGSFLCHSTGCQRTLTDSSITSTADVFPASIVAFSLFLSFLIAHLFLPPIYSSIFPPYCGSDFQLQHSLFQIFLGDKKKNLIFYKNNQPQSDSFYCPGLFMIKRPFHIIHESKLIHPCNLDFKLLGERLQFPNDIFSVR